MRIKVAELQHVTRQAILKQGYNEKEADIIQEVLLYAQLRGNNQGVIKLVGAGMPKSPQAGGIIVERETKLSARLNGNHNQGMVVITEAMNLAVQKALEHGFGIVGTHSTNTSTGAIGYYASKIAQKGLIGFVYAGSRLFVAPHGSYQPLYGTNPIAMGIPTEAEPVVLDITTAAIARFGIVQAKVAGSTIPDDVAYDNQGNPTTDPASALQGAIRAFDRSHRGSGLGFMFEALTGPLVTASFAGVGDTSSNWGNLVYAFDPALLVDTITFKKQMSEMVAAVKNSKKLPGVETIFTPGERGSAVMSAALKSGETEIEDNLWRELNVAAGLA